MMKDAIGPQSAMRDVLGVYPGAQRALFRRYHIGGCANCGFSPHETLEQLCQRNGGLDANEVLDQILASHEQDGKILIEPTDLAQWLEHEKSIRLLDVRSREEFEAVHIEGAVLMSQPVMQEIMGEGTNSRPLVIIDHQGGQGLDAAAYFLGHGLTNVRCLRGGIDAWSREVDPKLPRYKLG
jgi:rhodanese-related sulfurtransferase